MQQTSSISQPKLSKTTLWLMTFGAGFIVANNYYNQPLLGEIAIDLKISESTASNIAMITQIGIAMGLFLLVPLGDKFNKRHIILVDFIFIILSLFAFAFSKNIEWMLVASFFIGLSSVVPQMFIPIAAQLSINSEKSKNVGLLMTGLLIGILGSRVFSGIVGDFLGWQAVYFIAAGIMLVMWILVYFFLPDVDSTFTGSYKSLVKSIFNYAKTLPSLRLASVRGGLALGAFLAFWTTLTFHLEQAPFFAGSDVAGSLGLVAVGGALSAAFVGKYVDRMNKNHFITYATLLMLVSWIVLGVWGFSYTGLIIGIFLLDVGLQSVHVTNQTIVFESNPEATSRLNTVYMTSYFIGGSFGTFLGGIGWGLFGWNGVIYVGIGLVSVMLIIHLFFTRRTNK